MNSSSFKSLPLNLEVQEDEILVLLRLFILPMTLELLYVNGIELQEELNDLGVCLNLCVKVEGLILIFICFARELPEIILKTILFPSVLKFL